MVNPRNKFLQLLHKAIAPREKQAPETQGLVKGVENTETQTRSHTAVDTSGKQSGKSPSKTASTDSKSPR